MGARSPSFPACSGLRGYEPKVRSFEVALVFSFLFLLRERLVLWLFKQKITNFEQQGMEQTGTLRRRKQPPFVPVERIPKTP